MQNGSLEINSPQQSPAAESVRLPAQFTKKEDAAHDQDGGPPAKKRKLTDTTPSSKTFPRHISPPWRKIAVDGPASFVKDGRRKSSRTNAIPLELQPQSATRQTRAAANKVEKNRGVSVRHSYSSSLSQSNQSNQSNHERPADRKTMSAVKPAQSGPGRPISSEEHTKSPLARRQHHPKLETSPTQTSKNTLTKRLSDAIHETTTGQHGLVKQHDGQRRKPHQPDLQARNSPESPMNLDQHQLLQLQSSTFSTSSPESLRKVGLQKIRFTVRMPPIVIQSPANIPQLKEYTSFREFLDKDDLEPKTGEGVLTTGQVVKEAKVRKRVKTAQRLGGRFDKELQEVLPERQKEPSRQYFHRDHLLAHVLHFRKLLQAEHQKHKSDAKRIAYEVAKRVRATLPKSAEEVEQEQIEQAVVQYRQVVKDVVRFWTSVEAEVNTIRQSEVEIIEQTRKMREFNEQVEKHTQMLAPRVNSDAPDIPEDDEESADSIDESSRSSEKGSEDNMSSSDTASEADGNADDADTWLTADQLRAKYASLPTADRPAVEGEELIHDSTALLQPYLNLDEPVVLEQVDNVLLDDDSESIDTNDGEESESDGSDESDSDGDINDGDEEPSTLRSLFGPQDHDERRSFASVSSSQHLEKGMANNHDQESSGRENIEGTMPGAASQITHRESSTSVKEPTGMSKPLVEILMEDHASIEPSTPASRHTSITKASDGESFTSSDVRADSQQAVTPLKSNTPHIKTPVPSLLRGTLREYQHEGLDWLAGLYANQRNGILADEMGLGKTIQSIALLAHLAVEYHVWGPHLIIVPSSVILNWEMEFKKFCPGFKVLAYYGSQAERKQKRRGWLDKDLWHVVVTSYQLVVQDERNFKRRDWHYMILDEAHNIKNFRSQRWQTMLTFKTRARLLLTGTPLQNNLTELWSLLFFLRPTDMAEDEDEAFAGLSDFSEWFRKPVDQILDQGRDTMDDEARDQVSKLHKVIRPYLLRRLKADVEKQMPSKYEHIELCRLSKRQRQLYDGFISLTETRETLASGNYFSIIDCLMKLRKVCNHPDLFETRPVTTSYVMVRPALVDFEVTDFMVRRRLLARWDEHVNLDFLRLAPVSNEGMSVLEVRESSRLAAFSHLEALLQKQQHRVGLAKPHPRSSISGVLRSHEDVGRNARMAELEHGLYQESFHHREKALFGSGLLSRLLIETTSRNLTGRGDAQCLPRLWELSTPSAKLDLVQSIQRRAELMQPVLQRFGCVTPAVVALDLAKRFLSDDGTMAVRQDSVLLRADPFHEARTRLSIAFPDKRLLQFDCGKLQRLDKLLRQLQAGGHRALIFTQMTKVLDILEQFLNIHGHRYLRLDGSTKIEQRQILTERFNNDTQFLAFILSSRSGGLGINLTGADTVIFYDLDWNPAMDKQCQDRCHRIGQTRDVHIYRFVSEHTIESNILRKSNQKRMLDDVVIQEGDFTTDYFDKLSVRDMLGDAIPAIDRDDNAALDKVLGTAKSGFSAVLEKAEDKEDAVAAKLAEREHRHADDGDFDERVASHDASGTPLTPGAETPAEDALTNLTDEAVDQVPGLHRRIRDLDEWVLESMIRWKNEELGEIKAETLGSTTRDKKSRKKKRGGEHRVRRVR